MRTLLLSLLALLATAWAVTAAAQQVDLNLMTQVGAYFGETFDNYFGTGTAMGDFDADGFDEFIIGAYGWNSYTGRNYYYDWQGSWPVPLAWTFQGERTDVAFDVVDQNLGDINGDGIDDFGLAEWWEHDRLDLFWGGQPFDSLFDFTVSQDVPGTIWGTSLDSCGDVNGDGGNDFCMGNGLAIAGDQARIYFGGEALDTIPDWVISSYNELIPRGLGDINGDGYNDLMVFFGRSNPRIYFGGSAMDTLPDLIFPPTSILKGPIGDVNNDGYNDFYIGGKVYLGGEEPDTIYDDHLLDEYGDLTNAYSVTHGDFNGDGISDILTADVDGFGSRASYLYLGHPHFFNGVPDAKIQGLDEAAWGGDMSAGDVNNDGRDEALISAPYYWFDYGVAFLYTGPETWIDYGDTVAVSPEELQRHPGWFHLAQNYPNPFNASTTLRFQIGKPSTVSLRVYDLQGNLVRTLIADKFMLPGGCSVA
ncbi:MAG: T9SS C-terminal target domain-containing protein, partial [Candidatus Zixiibacteriota bacterium]